MRDHTLISQPLDSEVGQRQSGVRSTAGIGWRLFATLLWCIVCFAPLAKSAIAGGGPENVLLVVNANSESSKTIANHYIRMRRIPASNVVYVDWEGDIEWCSAKKFMNRLLMPVLTTIDRRGLARQIDYVIYSSDFPWRVDLRQYFPDQKFPASGRPLASLTGVTYLWQYLAAENSGIVALTSNWYVPMSQQGNQVRCQKLGQVASRGFRHDYFWAADGSRAEDRAHGQQYLLSTMLGVTSGRGNSVAEVLSYLQRAAWADATRPAGTIYFLKNKDIRSQTRHDCYDEIVTQLLLLGVPARVETGKIPEHATDILGLMTGAAKFNFAKADDVILPGAICEHLTSLGGTLKTNSAQTPLTVFLRYGAAGASGTVSEPLALQAKFPLPTLQLHYARGCSLAESFYQSVAAPYQLLIVGDPLCQPWAVVPTIAVEGIEVGQQVHGTVSITPSAISSTAHTVDVFELYMDGRLAARGPAQQAVELDTTKLADGYHELRVVGIDSGPIETRGRVVVPFQVNNHGAVVELSVSPRHRVARNDTLTLTARQPGATRIILLQNRRKIAEIAGPEGEAQIAASTLGSGPVAIQAVGVGPRAAASAPVWFQVE